jgi:hypothetical protein
MPGVLAFFDYPSSVEWGSDLASLGKSIANALREFAIGPAAPVEIASQTSREEPAGCSGGLFSRLISAVALGVAPDPSEPALASNQSIARRHQRDSCANLCRLETAAQDDQISLP